MSVIGVFDAICVVKVHVTMSGRPLDRIDEDVAVESAQASRDT